MSLAYLGAITVTPTQAAQAVATLDMYASRLASFLPAYSSYRVPPAGVALYGGATMAVDASQQTVGLAPDYMKAAIAAWASMRAFAAERGVSLVGGAQSLGAGGVEHGRVLRVGCAAVQTPGVAQRRVIVGVAREQRAVGCVNRPHGVAPDWLAALRPAQPGAGRAARCAAAAVPPARGW
jgi:hypothetical protein